MKEARLEHPSFEAAFADLLESAFRLARRILGDPAAAEDVAAEACARAFAHWKRIGSLPYRDAWVMRVASNLAIDAVRRRHRRPLAFDVHAEGDDIATLRIALTAALRALPKRQRESVALRYLAGLPEREVAEALGVSVGTVKTHVSRGLAALRKRLGDRYEEVDHA